MNVQDFIKESIVDIKTRSLNKKVICAVSGGVDSTVAAILAQQAIGDNLVCIFVDHGLLRKNEVNEVCDMFVNKFSINLITVDAQERFLDRLKDVVDPEEKRKIIGHEFINVFSEEAAKISDADFLLQGTIYPDVIESGADSSSNVKSHHNVGGMPKDIKFAGLIEPLRSLYKSQVREVGLALNIPKEFVFRQPFPGPGLGVRVVGKITKQKLDILKEADYIFRSMLPDGIAQQYFAILTDIKSVGVFDDDRTYEYIVALRAVNTSDFMVADFCEIPYSILRDISNKIVNEVKGVNRVVYDITCKPPATIEWE